MDREYTAATCALRMLTNVQNKVKRLWWEVCSVISLLFCRSALTSVISRVAGSLKSLHGLGVRIVWILNAAQAAFRMTEEGALRSE